MFCVGPVPETKEFSNGNAVTNLGFNHLQGLPAEIIMMGIMFVESCCTAFEERSDIKLTEIHFSVPVGSVYYMHRDGQDFGVCWFWDRNNLL